jgi:hypothetical protein
VNGFNGKRGDDWELMISNTQYAFTSLHNVTQALIRSLRHERQVADELAALVWLLPDDPEGRRNAALDLWRSTRG